ncbi:MAG: ABC transporter ATP-binding protein [Firmicutes bacterium]|nr:ABC transporter ATP-binding protein [Bacillota bacterium]
MQAQASRSDARSVLALVKDYWPGQLLATILIGLSVAAQILVPLVIRKIMDEAIPARDMQLLGRYLYWMVGLVAATAVVQYLGEVVYALNGIAAEMDTRRRIFGVLPRLEFSAIRSLNAGDVVNRCTTDVEATAATVSELFPALMVNVISGVALAGTMIVLNYQLALVCFAAIALAFVVLAALSGKVQRYSVAEREQMGAIAASISETFTNSRVVKARNAYEWIQKRFDGIQDTYRRIKTRKSYVIKLQAQASNSLSFLATVAVIAFGSYLVLKGELTVGLLFSFFMYLNMLFGPLHVLIQIGTVLSGLRGSIKRVFDVLEWPVEPVGAATGRGGEVGTRAGDEPGSRNPQRIRQVEFRDVHFAYDHEPILTGVSFRLVPGTLAALVGSIGAGKTTILNLLLRLVHPQSGQILVDGVPIEGLDLSWLRSQIGYVEQDVQVFDGSVRENILLGWPEQALKRLEEWGFRAVLQRAFADLPQGMDTVVGQKGVALSGGQKQILAMLRALVHDPSVVLMDEPTSSIDPETEGLVHDLLARLKEERIVLVVAHRQSTVQIADRVLTLQAGRLAETAAQAG